MKKYPLVNLRPHHIVCIQHFTGCGYNPHFIDNMKRIVNNLQPDAQIKISIGVDDLCAACPHNNEGICSQQERVMRMDKQSANIMGVHDGDILPYGKIAQKISAYIKTSNGLPALCSDCEWFDLCLSVSANANLNVNANAKRIAG